MAASTGIVLVMGGIVLANDTLVKKQPLNFRAVLATGILALVLAGLDKASPELATGIALVAFTTAMIAPANGASPAQSLLAFAGFGG
jgi:hypothetical protein